MTGKLSYLITISQRHILPALTLLRTLKPVTDAEIVAVGNLEPDDARRVSDAGARYIDERDIDRTGRWPTIEWTEKRNPIGWYRQMMIRLSIDRFLATEQVVILDSEVFCFTTWDESRFYDPATGYPRCFYWISSQRKPDFDYTMYRGAAFLLRDLPMCPDIMAYANSDGFRRHISGVVLFSTRNVRELWRLLEAHTDLEKNLDELFNHQPDLTFSDHDFYGLGVDYKLFEQVVPTVLHDNLLGWYDNHDDPVFHQFKNGAMWSMCQHYWKHPTTEQYLAYARKTAAMLGADLPELGAPQ